MGEGFFVALRVLTCFVSFASAYMPKLTHFTVRPSPTKLRFAGTPDYWHFFWFVFFGNLSETQRSGFAQERTSSVMTEL